MVANYATGQSFRHAHACRAGRRELVQKTVRDIIPNASAKIMI